jgi:hypothetical protein
LRQNGLFEFPIHPENLWLGAALNTEGKVAVVPVASKEYKRLKNDPSIQQFRAMQSKRS